MVYQRHYTHMCLHTALVSVWQGYASEAPSDSYREEPQSVIHSYIHTYMHTYIHMYTYTNTYVLLVYTANNHNLFFIHTHTHTHTPFFV